MWCHGHSTRHNFDIVNNLWSEDHRRRLCVRAAAAAPLQPTQLTPELRPLGTETSSRTAQPGEVPRRRPLNPNVDRATHALATAYEESSPHPPSNLRRRWRRTEVNSHAADTLADTSPRPSSQEAQAPNKRGTSTASPLSLAAEPGTDGSNNGSIAIPSTSSSTSTERPRSASEPRRSQFLDAAAVALATGSAAGAFAAASRALRRSSSSTSSPAGAPSSSASSRSFSAAGGGSSGSGYSAFLCDAEQLIRVIAGPRLSAQSDPGGGDPGSGAASAAAGAAAAEAAAAAARYGLPGSGYSSTDGGNGGGSGGGGAGALGPAADIRALSNSAEGLLRALDALEPAGTLRGGAAAATMSPAPASAGFWEWAGSGSTSGGHTSSAPSSPGRSQQLQQPQPQPLQQQRQLPSDQQGDETTPGWPQVHHGWFEDPNRAATGLAPGVLQSLLLAVAPSSPLQGSSTTTTTTSSAAGGAMTLAAAAAPLYGPGTSPFPGLDLGGGAGLLAAAAAAAYPLGALAAAPWLEGTMTTVATPPLPPVPASPPALPVLEGPGMVSMTAAGPAALPLIFAAAGAALPPWAQGLVAAPDPAAAASTSAPTLTAVSLQLDPALGWALGQLSSRVTPVTPRPLDLQLANRTVAAQLGRPPAAATATAAADDDDDGTAAAEAAPSAAARVRSRGATGRRGAAMPPALPWPLVLPLMEAVGDRLSPPTVLALLKAVFAQVGPRWQASLPPGQRTHLAVTVRALLAAALREPGNVTPSVAAGILAAMARLKMRSVRTCAQLVTRVLSRTPAEAAAAAAARAARAVRSILRKKSVAKAKAALAAFAAAAAAGAEAPVMWPLPALRPWRRRRWRRQAPAAAAAGSHLASGGAALPTAAAAAAAVAGGVGGGMPPRLRWVATTLRVLSQLDVPPDALPPGAMSQLLWFAAEDPSGWNPSLAAALPVWCARMCRRPNRHFMRLYTAVLLNPNPSLAAGGQQRLMQGASPLLQRRRLQPLPSAAPPPANADYATRQRHCRLLRQQRRLRYRQRRRWRRLAAALLDGRNSEDVVDGEACGGGRASTLPRGGGGGTALADQMTGPQLLTVLEALVELYGSAAIVPPQPPSQGRVWWRQPRPSGAAAAAVAAATPQGALTAAPEAAAAAAAEASVRRLWRSGRSNLARGGQRFDPRGPYFPFREGLSRLLVRQLLRRLSCSERLAELDKQQLCRVPLLLARLRHLPTRGSLWPHGFFPRARELLPRCDETDVMLLLKGLAGLAGAAAEDAGEDGAVKEDVVVQEVVEAAGPAEDGVAAAEAARVCEAAELADEAVRRYQTLLPHAELHNTVITIHALSILWPPHQDLLAATAATAVSPPPPSSTSTTTTTTAAAASAGSQVGAEADLRLRRLADLVSERDFLLQQLEEHVAQCLARGSSTWQHQEQQQRKGGGAGGGARGRGSGGPGAGGGGRGRGAHSLAHLAVKLVSAYGSLQRMPPPRVKAALESVLVSQAGELATADWVLVRRALQRLRLQPGGKLGVALVTFT